MRFFTVPKVKDARISAGWALVFIGIMYTTVPALSAFSRVNMIETINGADSQGVAYESAPQWIKNWENRFESGGTTKRRRQTLRSRQDGRSC